MNPYLSVVMVSRNDNHGGDLNERTQACIDSLSEQYQASKLPIEVIMVEWNSPTDKPLLYQIINHKHIPFRSIIVPSNIHETYGQHDRLPIYQMIAKNVGIRRALGEFVLATNVDIFFSNELINRISIKNLNAGLLYRAYRYDAKKGIRTLKEAQKNLIRINLSYKDELCTNACGDFQMMHNKDWKYLRGYYEADLFSIHLDSLFEYHAYYNGFPERIFHPPKVTYHVEHDGGWVPGVEKSKQYNRMNDNDIKKLSYEEFLQIVSMMAKKQPPFHYNNSDWGLAKYKLEEMWNEEANQFRTITKNL